MTYTFEITGNNANCSLTSKETDIQNLVNSVTVLGYGDGTNQVKATASDSTSISQYGTKSQTINDRSIRITSVAQDIADGYLADHKDPIIRIKVIPDDPLDILYGLKVGDLARVIDSEAESTGKYIIVGIIYTFDYGSLGCEIELSNKGLGLIEYLNKEREESESHQKYMQGSTNIYWFGKEDNCNNTYPLKISIFIPEDAVAINKAILRFSRPAFRGYSASDDPDHAGSYIISTGTVDEEIDNEALSLDLVDNINATPSGSTFIGNSAVISIFNLSGSSHTYTLKIEQPAGTQLGTWTGTIADRAGRQLYYEDGVDRRGGTWRFKILNARRGDNISALVNYNIATFGIYTPTSESDVNVTVKVDSTTITTINNVSVDYEHTSDIDITSYVSTGWNTIILEPIAKCRLSLNGYVKCFIESR